MCVCFSLCVCVCVWHKMFVEVVVGGFICLLLFLFIGNDYSMVSKESRTSF